MDLVQISRYYGCDFSKKTTDLHVFDASNQTYGVLANIRDIINGNVQVLFVMAKEDYLQSITMRNNSEVRIISRCNNHSDKNKIALGVIDCCNEVYFWVYSKTVLRYIQNEKKRFSVFISDRINKICNNSKIQN